MPEDRLNQMFHNETEHISAPSLSPRSRRRIRLRQGSLLTGIAASLAIVTMAAMSFADGPLKNEVAGDYDGPVQVDETAEAEGPVLVETVTSGGSGKIWGRPFVIDVHTGENIDGSCYVLRVQGFEPSDCVELSRGSSELRIGGGVITGWNRAFTIVDAPTQIDVGVAGKAAAQMWVSGPPFEQRGLGLIVFNRPRTSGVLAELMIPGGPSDTFQVNILDSFEMSAAGFEVTSSGPSDVTISIDLPFGQYLWCPRLLPPAEREAALRAVEAWAEWVEPEVATGHTEISLGVAPERAPGCPDWIAGRSLMASFSWQGGPYNDSASLSQVRVLVGRAIGGEWKVWRQEH